MMCFSLISLGSLRNFMSMKFHGVAFPGESNSDDVNTFAIATAMAEEGSDEEWHH